MLRRWRWEIEAMPALGQQATLCDPRENVCCWGLSGRNRCETGHYNFTLDKYHYFANWLASTVTLWAHKSKPEPCLDRWLALPPVMCRKAGFSRSVKVLKAIQKERLQRGAVKEALRLDRWIETYRLGRDRGWWTRLAVVPCP